MDNTVYFYNVLLLLVVLFPMMIPVSQRPNQVIEVPKYYWSFLLICFGVWCMATKPIIVGSWSDRGAYAGSVIDFQTNGYHFEGFHGESLFGLYTWIVSLFTDYKGWFWVTAFIYMANGLIVSLRLTKEYAFVLFMSIICNFQYFSYGSNTIRAGFALSFILLGISFCDSKKMMVSSFFFAFFCHTSVAIIIAALTISYFIPGRSRLFIVCWFLCIAISYFGGSFFEAFFMRFADSRRMIYFIIDAAKTNYRVGFRWDFLLYSTIPIIMGYYYIFALGFKSIFYQWIYSAYIIANSIWILVIRAEYSDRFAYLSWFLFPIILLYPILSQQLYRDVAIQKRNIVLVLWGQFSFSYYMFLAYNGFKPF